MTLHEQFKNQLAKDLKALHGRGYYGIIASRAGVSHETVRQYFTLPQRRNPIVEMKAVDFRAELIESNKAKLQSLEP